MEHVDLGKGWWPFHVGYEYNDAEIIKLILSDPNSDPACLQNDAIITASEDGNAEIVALFLNDTRVDPSDNDNAALIAAVENNRTEVVKLLLKDPRVNPGARNNQVIADACVNGDLEIITLLMNDSRVDPSDQDNAALIRARRADVLKLLLSDPRVDPRARNNIALETAIKMGRDEVLEVLLNDSRVDPSSNDCAAFRLACEWQRAGCFQLLSKDSRAVPSDLSCQFSIACMSKNSSIAELLFNNFRDDNSWNYSSAAVNACSWGSFKTFKMLMSLPEVYESLNFQQVFELVLTSYARSNGETLEFVKFLLAHPKVDPRSYGKSLVEKALSAGHLEAAGLLLRDSKMNSFSV